MHSFITVIGNVGAGKSTLARFLAENLPAHLITSDEFYKTNPFFQEAVINRSSWSLASDVWFLIRRVEMAQKLEKILTKRTVVQDSGLLMSWVYANSRLTAKHMNANETNLYNELFEKLTAGTVREDLVIYVNLPIPLLRQRIVKRGRAFEVTYHSETYLSGLDRSIQKLVAHLKKRHTPILEFNETNPFDIQRVKQTLKTL